MKKTVKTWCKDFGYTWYGPGVYSAEKYDYKIQFLKGVFALFRTAHGRCFAPRQCITGKGKAFLIFPVFSQFLGHKEISRTRFAQAVDWVLACLQGKISQFPSATALQLGEPEGASRCRLS
ncbi:hypothetical protein [Thiorhodovibrio winogradskyi]|nr:hypothetical protein [Thiorhodovibrio winogradskyi]